MSVTLTTAAWMDAMGRFVANVGVPAAIAFFILWQLSPRIDQLVVLQTQSNTELTIIATTCGRTGPSGLVP